MYVNDKLHVLMHIDLSTIDTRLGTRFVLDENSDTYYDDTIDSALNGETELVFENKFFGNRHVYKYASPVIDWHFTSQRLHFGAINHYKHVKALNINVKGNDIMRAKLLLKTYRNFYHPEESMAMEININDLRTFVKRMNIMHAINFQYTLENDSTSSVVKPLELNSVSIKYEVKERIR